VDYGNRLVNLTDPPGQVVLSPMRFAVVTSELYDGTTVSIPVAVVARTRAAVAGAVAVRAAEHRPRAALARVGARWAGAGEIVVDLRTVHGCDGGGHSTGIGLFRRFRRLTHWERRSPTSSGFQT